MTKICQLCHAGGPVIWDVRHVTTTSLLWFQLGMFAACPPPRSPCFLPVFPVSYLYLTKVYMPEISSSKKSRLRPIRGILHHEEDQCSRKHSSKEMLYTTQTTKFTFILQKDPQQKSNVLLNCSMLQGICIVRYGASVFRSIQWLHSLITWVWSDFTEWVPGVLERWDGNTEFHVIWSNKLKSSLSFCIFWFIN